MHIDIVSDVICPWCYVGKRRFEKALAARPELAPAVSWRAFRLNPGMPAEGVDRESYLRAKFGDRVEQFYEMIREAGEAEGIRFAFDRIERTPSTLNAHRLVRWSAARGVQDAVVEALFHRYFEEAEDIGQTEVLVAAAGDAGLDGVETRRFLESGEGAAEVVAEDETARAMGIYGVPCFIVEKKYAVSGAQAPEVFSRVFDVALENERAST